MIQAQPDTTITIMTWPHELDVHAFDDDGHALVLDPDTGRLVRATDYERELLAAEGKVLAPFMAARRAGTEPVPPAPQPAVRARRSDKSKVTDQKQSQS